MRVESPNLKDYPWVTAKDSLTQAVSLSRSRLRGQQLNGLCRLSQFRLPFTEFREKLCGALGPNLSE